MKNQKNDRLLSSAELKIENENIKKKLTEEFGMIKYGSVKENDLPEEMENNFLNNVMEYEKQFAEGKMIKVYDRLGRPDYKKNRRAG